MICSHGTKIHKVISYTDDFGPKMEGILASLARLWTHSIMVMF